MKIKICGITSTMEAKYLNDNNVDYGGFVFYKKSKRNLTIDQASVICDRLKPDIKKVAVMVSPALEEVINIIEAGFDIIQIHQDIDIRILDEVDASIWLAINFTEDEFNKKSEFINQLTAMQRSKITGIVIDAENFGSGQTFDWYHNKDKLQGEFLSDRKLILAGGLNSDNVKDAINLIKPDVVDVSSGVEIDKDIIGKSESKIKAFVEAVREASL